MPCISSGNKMSSCCLEHFLQPLELSTENGFNVLSFWVSYPFFCKSPCGTKSTVRLDPGITMMLVSIIDGFFVCA